MASRVYSSVKLYVDMMSQPCRAVVLTAKLLKAPYKAENVLISRGGTLTPEFRRLNPMGLLPVAEFSDGPGGDKEPFVLTESTTIMRHLCDTNPSDVAERLYPSHDLRARARVDSMLDWYHSSLRQGTRNWVFHGVISGLLGRKPEEALVAYGVKTSHRCLKVMQTWLAERPFLAGHQLTLADIIALCELDQLYMLDTREHDWSDEKLATSYPAVRAWQQRCRAELEPHMTDVNAILLRGIAALQKSRASSAVSAAEAGAQVRARL